MTDTPHGMTYGEAVKDTLTQLAPIFNAIRATKFVPNDSELIDGLSEAPSEGAQT